MGLLIMKTLKDNVVRVLNEIRNLKKTSFYYPQLANGAINIQKQKYVQVPHVATRQCTQK